MHKVQLLPKLYCLSDWRAPWQMTQQMQPPSSVSGWIVHKKPTVLRFYFYFCKRKWHIRSSYIFLLVWELFVSSGITWTRRNFQCFSIKYKKWWVEIIPQVILSTVVCLIIFVYVTYKNKLTIFFTKKLLFFQIQSWQYAFRDIATFHFSISGTVLIWSVEQKSCLLC